jgi:cell division protease FtsH
MLTVFSYYLFLILISSINCSKRVNFHINDKSTFLKSSNNDYIQDLNLNLNSLYRHINFDKKDYNDVIKDLLDNKVEKIFVDKNYKELVFVDNLPNDDLSYNHYHVVDINPVVLPNLIDKTTELHVPIYFENFVSENLLNFQNILNEIFTVSNGIFTGIFTIFILGSLISGLRNINMMSRQSTNISNRKRDVSNPFSFMENLKQEENEFIKPNLTIDSWAGSPEVIEECNEVISYIENKEKYKLIGADMPKGILLEGPPGTGKTLLAKAIAGETNSTFISMSGSEFVELFVGMGAARVRELFNDARKNTPCIIFIDEIDAVARQRGAGINMANDEREQTLNQLLYEMDGFNNNDNILVMAATNRKDVLDQAILRPGRFDRIIRVSLPDKDSREKILSFYLKNKNLEKPFDISSIAELTDGFSGAQLKNLINEAAIISARNNFTSIQEKFVFDAFEKSIIGLIKRNSTIASDTKLRVSIHESGHSLLVLYFSNYFEFQKASIQATYNGAGGYTIFSEKPEFKNGLYTKDMLKKRLIIAMGGKAAESIYYGNDFVSLGAIQDLKDANSLSKRMIGNFGMGDKLEVFFNEEIGDDTNPFLGRSLALGNKYSEYTRFIMDKESLNLVKEAYSLAKDILEKNREQLVEFSEMLQNNTVIYNNELKDKFIFRQ